MVSYRSKYKAQNRNEKTARKTTNNTKVLEKQKEDEALAEVVYQEYLSTFADETNTGVSDVVANPIAFVKSGGNSGDPPTSFMPETPIQPPKSVYRYKGTPTNTSAPVKSDDGSLNVLTGTLGYVGEGTLHQYKKDMEKIQSQPVSGVRYTSKSNLESFKQELIQKHILERSTTSSYYRSERIPHKRQDGCTNVHISKLNPQTVEKDIVEIFGKYGSLASVRIMKPKGIENRHITHNYGFVAYMEQEHAINAIEALNGRRLQGQQLVLDWGRPLSVMPELPLYECVNPIKPPPKSGSVTRTYVCVEKEDDSKLVDISVPSNPEKLHLIHLMCQYVINYGLQFELLIISREYHNRDYKFLHDVNTPDYWYYRWKLFSLLKEGTMRHWTKHNYKIYINGPTVVPPNLKLEGGYSNSAQNPEYFGQFMTLLPQYYAAKANLYLSRLDGSRRPVAKFMVWCIRHASMAESIIDHITYYTLLNETPIEKKVQYLMVMSDILYNSSAPLPKAYDFRRRIECVLPALVTHLKEAIDTCETTSQRETIKNTILPCFNAWSNWAMYTPNFISNLRCKFLGVEPSSIEVESSKAKEKNHNNNYPADEEGDIDGEPLNVHDGLKLLQDTTIMAGIDGVPFTSELFVEFEKELLYIHGKL